LPTREVRIVGDGAFLEQVEGIGDERIEGFLVARNVFDAVAAALVEVEVGEELGPHSGPGAGGGFSGHSGCHFLAGNAFLAGALKAREQVGIEGNVIRSPIRVAVLLNPSVVLLSHGESPGGSREISQRMERPSGARFRPQSFEPTKPALLVESRLHFTVGAGNDVGGNQAIAHALASISASANGCVHSTGFAADENGHVTAAHEFATDQAHFGCLGHGVSGFDRGDQTPGLDHAEGDAHGFVCHYLLLEEGVECSLATMVGR